jgi:hypothetical protein
VELLGAGPAKGGGRRLLRIAGLLGLVALLSGCAAVIASYRYISLERYADAAVVRRDRPSPGVIQWSIGEVPLAYEVARAAYTLRFEIDPHDYAPVHPAITVRVLPAGSGPLGIRPEPVGTPPDCHPWDGPAGDPLPAQVTYRHGHGCDLFWVPPGYRMRFRVVDQGGAEVGTEEIPYTVEEDGAYLF